MSKPFSHYYTVVGECWEWSRSRKWNGYGQKNVRGQIMVAHRVAGTRWAHICR